MKRFFAHQGPALALLVAVLVAMSFLPARAAGFISAGPRHFVRKILGPLTEPLHRVGSALRRPEETEAEPLPPTVDPLVYARRLEQEIRWKDDLIKQLTQTRQLSLAGVTLVPARVTQWSGRPRSHRRISIDRGERSSVRLGQAVTDGFNLVGRVTEFGAATATVHLITSSGTSLVVRIVPASLGPAPRELVVQRLRASDDGSHFIGHCTTEDEVQQGDLAHLYDQDWPEEAGGFVVGNVDQVIEDPASPHLRRIIIVRPARSLAHLSRVAVVVPEHQEPEP